MATEQTTITRYIVVPAPGHYGDTGRVYSSHASLEAARRAQRGYGALAVVREGSKRKGDTWRRSDEQHYPAR